MRLLLVSAALLANATTVRAELAPDEVAVIAMAESGDSQRLAEYYVRARGIPDSHILLLPGKPAATMQRTVWETQVRPTIRAWLTENGLERTIRCFVTVWDVPLRIGRREGNSPLMVSRKRYLTEVRASAAKEFAELVAALDSVAQGEKRPQHPAPTADVSPEELGKLLESAAKAAQERLRQLESEDSKREAVAVFERVFLLGGGVAAVLRTVQQRPDLLELKPEAQRKVDFSKGRLQGLSEGLQALADLPESVARDMHVLGLVRKTGGLLGAIRWIDQQLQLLNKNETYASFDSELSLLYWPDYSAFRWQPNLLHYRFDGLPPEHRATFMVSRLEAPTLELTRKLVDAAIAAEETGLSGTVYLDARGIAYNPEKPKPGSYGQYDQSLRDLAERLKKHTQLEVVLDDRAELFQPGDCPGAAIYCGWYSLAKYVDAFQWQPGAVGYHLASSEAATLRQPGSKVWCNAMLEDGVCATLGPVHEPYLAAFPPPDDFFPLLLTGRYTLAEAYYRAKPFNSWVMVLVGDPLYSPFRKDPPLPEAALPERLRPRESAGSPQADRDPA